MIPGKISKKITLKKACKGVQPRSNAASLKFLSICVSLGKTARITYDRLKLMWAIRRVVKPNTLLMRSALPTKTKTRAKDTPVTMSGLVSGMFVTVSANERSLPLMLYMPKAAIVPITVAISEERAATMSEFPSKGKSAES